MSLRRTIAEWLCPELRIEADRLWRLRVEMSDKIRWLAHEYPIVEVVLARLMVDDLNYARKLGEAPRDLNFPHLGGHWPSDIYSFREKLRMTFPQPMTEDELMRGLEASGLIPPGSSSNSSNHRGGENG